MSITYPDIRTRDAPNLSISPRRIALLSAVIVKVGQTSKSVRIRRWGHW